MRLRYVGYALDSTGYGEFARLMLSALHEAGHDIELVLLSNRCEEPHRFGKAGELVTYLSSRRVEGACANIVNTPPNAFEQGIHSKLPNIGLSMCERFTVPEHWVAACNRMTALMVPAEHSKLAFSHSGVTVPIHVVPPGAPFAPLCYRDTPSTSDRPWTFLSIFDWTHPHKDPERLLRGYWEAFQGGEDVLLRVKTFPRPRDGEKRIIDDVNRWKAASGLSVFPKVELVMGSWCEPERDLNYLERTDVYVSSHHSEGWGLPLWEAMRHGVPTIATAYGGNMAFMHRHNSMPVAYTLRVGEWADVHVRHLSQCMRWTYENQGQARELGHEGRKSVLTDFTRKNSERAFSEALRAIGLAAGAQGT